MKFQAFAAAKQALRSALHASAGSSALRAAVPAASRGFGNLAGASASWNKPRRIAVMHTPLVQQRRSMFIQTESTPNEDSLKFLPGRQVMESGTFEFLDTRASMKSPLAKKLFNISGVVGVFYGPDFVTVSKDSAHQWSTLKPEIYSSIMEFFTAGHPLFTDPESSQGSSDTVILDTDSEVVAMIKELLDTRVRPAIQEDGGDLEYRGFGEDTDGIVRVKLKGSCRGCDSSTVTLKSGIERMLKHYIPEVKAVEQILDPEEEIALDEFAKLEKKLEKDRQKERDMGFSL
ncbi:HIRA-interacting protein 5 [Testicularia cyperi]|uniref:HIRA-interacting protein 5 n=1 Tax=Testicularia cyperi TaxID=1882483 RepID=A0A317XKU7_9BASI|nr:HIRA-interacting protein 5 [Testicularia cyperi]